MGGLDSHARQRRKNIQLLNEFQGNLKIKMMIGIDGEWIIVPKISKPT